MMLDKFAQDSTDTELKLEKKHKLFVDELKKRYEDRLIQKNEKIKELEISDKALSEETHQLKLEIQEKSLTIRAIEKELRERKHDIKVKETEIHDFEHCINEMKNNH